MTTTATRLDLVERAKFSTDKPDQIRNTIKGLLENGEIKLREIAKFTSFAAPTISQVISGTYEGDMEKLDDALARFYRSYIAKYAIVETSVVKEIHATMLLCWKRKEIGQIVGHFGCGKSKAVGRFVALNSEYAVYVELMSTTSATSLLHRIGDALNIESVMVGSKDDKLFAVIRSLQRRPRLLVVDEADNLSVKTLAILKDIHGDEAAERCAIVLIGTEKLNRVLQDPLLGYLRRRIRIKRTVGDISFEEAKKICEMWPNSLDRDEIKDAWNWSLKHFGVASLVALMARSYDEQQLRGKRKIDSECLEGGFSWLMD